MTVDSIGNTPYPLPAAPAGKRVVDKSSELYKASLEFEAIFIKQMLDVMRKTVQKDGLLDGGMGQEIWEDMLYDEYARKMAETAQFGLAESIYWQVSSKL